MGGALGALAVWLFMVTLALRGWRKRGNRQVDELGAFPDTPTDLGDPIRGALRAWVLRFAARALTPVAIGFLERKVETRLVEAM